MIETVMPTYARNKIGFEKGSGCWLYGTDGKAYLDAGSGIAVNSLGHSHPKLIEALTEQAGQVWHTSNLYRIPIQERLASLLVQHTFADTVFFTNSGAEAVECAVKTARKFWHHKGQPARNQIITLNQSFHGRTLGMISAAGNEKLTRGFAPLLPGFIQVEPNDLVAAEKEIGEHTAAILIEPILGEGGILPLDDIYLKKLRLLCDSTGTLLIVDEIQSGMGRTGKLFAHEFAGISPDIMAIAKGIGGGFPIGACLATEQAAIGMTVGSHGSTFGGNPLACAVGCAVMEIIANNDMLHHVRTVARDFRQQLESLIGSHPDIFEEIRGEGLMLGIKCKVPNSAVIEACFNQQLLTIIGGDNVVRILPPLIIDQEDATEIVKRLDKAAEHIRVTQDA